MARAHRHDVLHRRPNGRAVPPAVLASAVLALLVATPARTGPPPPADPAAHPAATASAFRAHLLASPFGTIHASTFRFSPPVGTETPPGPGVELADYAAIEGGSALPGGDDDPPRDFPVVNRRLKGARLPSGRAENAPAEAAADAGNTAPPDRDTAAAAQGGRAAAPPAIGDGALIRVARIYFMTAAAPEPAALERIAPEPWPVEPPGAPQAEMSPADAPSNETIAAKGEVTGAGRGPKSPAELLGLTGPARARHERCLADAIYFEARGEPVRGQMAVAQVVINRVFSGYYPGSICGVVYQSTRRHRRLRCQFSFTCDRIPDRVTEPDAWERATRIARDALDGHFWLNDIGKATHYHARWVHPRWVREMRRLDRIGVHTFYRPRRWGDGAAAPVWGDASAKVEKL